MKFFLYLKLSSFEVTIVFHPLLQFFPWSAVNG